MENRTGAQALEEIMSFNRTYFYSELDSDICRNNLLELIHELKIEKLTKGELTELINCCNKAIKSYRRCVGYSKHWSHFKHKFNELYKN